MNPANHPKDIPCDTIIEWMNEWRGGEDNDASSVPKFEESKDLYHSDIRVQFDGMYTCIHSQNSIVVDTTTSGHTRL